MRMMMTGIVCELAMSHHFSEFSQNVQTTSQMTVLPTRAEKLIMNGNHRSNSYPLFESHSIDYLCSLSLYFHSQCQPLPLFQQENSFCLFSFLSLAHIFQFSQCLPPFPSMSNIPQETLLL